MLLNKAVVTWPITNGAITVKMVLTEANSRTKNSRSLWPFRYPSSRLKVWVFISDPLLSQLDLGNFAVEGAAFQKLLMRPLANNPSIVNNQNAVGV